MYKSTNPDNILLEIFRHLPARELCIAGSVCRRWRRVCNDNSLWRYVDLSMYRLNLQKLWKVLRAHLSECLLSMKLKGFLDSGGTKWKKPSMSNAMLDDLKERCPNIRELELHCANTDNLDVTKLPNSLKRVTFSHCMWQPQWLHDRESRKLLPNLVWLDLSWCSRVDKFDMTDISKWTNLEGLVLNQCYRIQEQGLTTVATSLINLEHLEIAGTGCTDLVMHHISRNMPKLRYLDISKCSKLTEVGIATMVPCLKKLRTLNVASCKLITASGLSSLSKCSTLQFLTVGSEISDEELATLRSQVPRACVVKKDSSSQNSKQM